jgi:DNA-binding response OmpR family regulator
MLALLVAQQSDLWKQPQRWLVQMGWETAQVVSCVLGRKELEQNPGVDLVLLDAGTAEECGLKLIGVLKSESRLARIPIIVCATDIDHDLALKYMELGVDNILLLPTVRETFEAKVRKASENGKPRVLVVDDEEMIRDLLHDFLKLERYTPLLASSVDEALRIIQTEPVDAIVTDIMMPGKTGIDLLVEVKRDHAHIDLHAAQGDGPPRAAYRKPRAALRVIAGTDTETSRTPGRVPDARSGCPSRFRAC